MVEHYGTRGGQRAPTGYLCPPREVRVLVVHEESLVEATEFFEHFHSEK
jgi:hypothetical protein